MFSAKAPTIYLAQNKWLSLIALTGKAVIGPKPPTVRQAFVVDCGEAEAYHARRR